MTPKLHAELRRLLNALHDGAIEQADFERLQELLRNEPEGRDLHLAYSDLHTRLVQLQNKEAGSGSADWISSGVQSKAGKTRVDGAVPAPLDQEPTVDPSQAEPYRTAGALPSPASDSAASNSSVSSSAADSDRAAGIIRNAIDDVLFEERFGDQSPVRTSKGMGLSASPKRRERARAQSAFPCVDALFSKQVSLGFATTAFVAACLMGILVAPWLLDARQPPVVAEAKPTGPDPSAAATIEHHPPAFIGGIATVAGGVNVAIDGSGMFGNRIRPGSVKLRRGLARVIFDGGAVVVVQGPTELEVVDESTCRLVSGAMSVKVSPEADPLYVEADGLRVSERSAEFAVRRVRHNDTELHVFNGRLQLIDSRGTDPTTLQVAEGQGLRWTSAGRATTLSADRRSFISDAELLQREHEVASEAYSRWQRYSDRWLADPSVALWYDFNQLPEGDLVAKCRATGEHMATSAQSHPRWVGGRWPDAKALLFDGRTDVLHTEDSESLRFGREFTLATWIKIRSNPTRCFTRVVGKGAGFRRNYGLWLHPEGSFLWQVCPDENLDPSNNWDRFSLSSEIASTGEWHHIVGTVGGGRMRLYFNGELQASRVVPADVATSDAPLTIGRFGDLPNHDEFFCGEMSELLLLRRELTPGEVQQAYAAGQNYLLNPVVRAQSAPSVALGPEI